MIPKLEGKVHGRLNYIKVASKAKRILKNLLAIRKLKRRVFKSPEYVKLVVKIAVESIMTTAFRIRYDEHLAHIK